MVDDFKGIILEFGYAASSPNYDSIVSDAHEMDGYTSLGDKNRIRHKIPLTEQGFKSWFQVFDAVSGWKSTKLYYRGESFSPRDHRAVLSCYESRCNSANKEEYCSENNWLGCRRIGLGKSLLSIYGFGEFIEEKAFRPNKERIKSSVKRDLEKCRICPALNADKVIVQLNTLEDLIDLSDPDSMWVIEKDGGLYSNNRQLIGISYKSELNGISLADADEDEENLYFPTPIEYKVLILTDDEWNRCAGTNEASKLNELGKMGWHLITVVHSDRNWHCVFEREIEYIEDIEDIDDMED